MCEARITHEPIFSPGRGYVNLVESIWERQARCSHGHRISEAAACGCDPAPFVKSDEWGAKPSRKNPNGETRDGFQERKLEERSPRARIIERSALQQGDLRILAGGNRDCYADLGAARVTNTLFPGRVVGPTACPLPVFLLLYRGSRYTWQREGTGSWRHHHAVSFRLFLMQSGPGPHHWTGGPSRRFLGLNEARGHFAARRERTTKRSSCIMHAGFTRSREESPEPQTICTIWSVLSCIKKTDLPAIINNILINN